MIWTILLCLIIGLLFYKAYKSHRYWAEKGVIQNKNVNILGDNYPQIFKTLPFAKLIEKHYNAFPGKRYGGIYEFFQPLLVIRDPELIKQVGVKDFEHFMDHRQVFPEGSEPMWTKNLFALTGQKWRHMRATLSPSFTSSKMKMMFHLMADCAESFSKQLFKDAGKEFEMKDIFTRFANDVIATTAFGVQVDSYTNKENDFYKMGKKVTDFSGWWINIKFLFFIATPKLAQLLGMKMFDNSARYFFKDLVSTTIKAREEKGIVRQDLIHLLMEARKGNQIKEEQVEADTGFATVEESEIGKGGKIQREELTDEDICAQALIFFFAGFDSVSTLMNFMAYELAINPDIQDKLRAEIDETLDQCNGKVTYEGLMKMKYMDMVVSESLRKWPNAVAVDRRCTKQYTIQSANPDEKNVELSKDDVLWIPIFGIHWDPEFYPEPERFDPERFSDENKNNIKPYTYLPFGVGPRNCIGSRFALLETKIIFFYLLSKMELVPSAKTPIPMKLSTKSFALQADPGTFLEIRPRKKN